MKPQRYTVTIPEDSLVGKEINEAALVDSDGDLVAIKNMYSKKEGQKVLVLPLNSMTGLT